MLYPMPTHRSIDMARTVKTLDIYYLMIAEAIRKKGGAQGTLKPSEMAEAIKSIPVGEKLGLLIDRSITGVTPEELEGLTEIAPYAFAGCEQLVSFKLPETITTIGDYACYGCSHLEFDEPYRLITLSIPNSVKKIGAYAFSNTDFYSFKYCNLGNWTHDDTYQYANSQIEEIGDGAFRNAAQLQHINIYSKTPPKLGNNVFEGTRFIKEQIYDGINVPNDCVDAYRSAEGWSEYADYIQGIVPTYDAWA